MSVTIRHLVFKLACGLFRGAKRVHEGEAVYDLLSLFHIARFFVFGSLLEYSRLLSNLGLTEDRKISEQAVNRQDDDH